MSSSFDRAKDYALNLLSRRAYTEKGLYDKLNTRYDEEISAAAVARMIELGLLDDEEYASRYASDLVKLKGMSNRRVMQELIRKGIDPDIAQSVSEENETEPEVMAARVIIRKFLRYLDDEKGKRKTVNALLRLGYGYNDIFTAIRNLQNDENYYDDYE